MKHFFTKKYALITGIILITTLALSPFIRHYILSQKKVGIVLNAPTSGFLAYKADLHKHFILKQFKEHWHILLRDPHSDPEYYLDTLSPNSYEAKYKGKLKVAVLHQNNEPVGFITYYLLSKAVGRIQFLAVDKAHWGNKHADKLVLYALDQLKKMGARSVRMATRVSNTKAQKIYKRLGFPIVNPDNEGFVLYRKEL